MSAGRPPNSRETRGDCRENPTNSSNYRRAAENNTNTRDLRRVTTSLFTFRTRLCDPTHRRTRRVSCRSLRVRTVGLCGTACNPAKTARWTKPLVLRAYAESKRVQKRAGQQQWTTAIFVGRGATNSVGTAKSLRPRSTTRFRDRPREF